MSLWKIAWRSVQQRAVASSLTTLSLALGVMLVVMVLLVLGAITESFRSNASLGFNMVVGAKGGSLQLVLNSLYYLSQPVENIPYEFYEEFLPAAQREDAKDGRYAVYTSLAVPICMGDYFGSFRVVGTTPQMFDNFVFDMERDRKYEFAQGRNLQVHSNEYGYFEAVVGATVARKNRLKVGQAIAPTHGVAGEKHDEFYVVGILAPTGTPCDRAVFVNMEGFFLLDGHAKSAFPPITVAATEPVGTVLNQMLDRGGTSSAIVVDQGRTLGTLGVRDGPLEPRATAVDGDIATPTPERPQDRRQWLPLPREQREVTAILLRTVNGAVAPGLRKTINKGPVAQAALPIGEMFSLFANFVTPLKLVLLGLTATICLVSGISILVSIYNSMNERRHDVAIMRALGAGRSAVMAIVLLESLILAIGGGVAGWAAGHLAVGGLARNLIEDNTGVSIGVTDLAPPLDLSVLAGDHGRGWEKLRISSEALLIPLLMLLAILVGMLPAVAAYRTDVAQTLSSSP